MADIAKTALTRDAGTAITFLNGAADQDIVADVKDDKLFLLITNADATAARIRAKAGDGIQGVAGQGVAGDAYVDVAQNAYAILGPFTGMRFKDVDTGKINVDITGTNDAAFGGTITNVKVRPIVLP